MPQGVSRVVTNERTIYLVFVAHINNHLSTPRKIFKKTTRMLRSDRFRVFKSSSHPKREGFHNTIKYKLQSTTKQSSKHLKKRKKNYKRAKAKANEKLPVLQLKSQLKEKREKKMAKIYYQI